MKRFLEGVLVALVGLLATNAYGQGGCMHGGGGGGPPMGGSMGMGMGGISSTIQQAYLQNQFAQQQYLQQLYLQQLYDQQQNAARQAERAARRADKIVMLKERRASELAKKSGAKGITGSPAETRNLSETILAGKK